MGCDIHPVVQVRRAGTWETIPLESGPGDKYGPAIRYRNYNAFGVLANVRNTGSGEPFPFIQEGRGFPEGFEVDSCEYFVAPDGTRYDMGDHSFGYVTLAELEAYDWNRTRLCAGVISEGQYLEWDRASPVHNYCQAVGGLAVVTFDSEEYDRRKKNGELPHDRNIYVSVTWSELIRDCVGAFYSQVIPWLRTLGAPDDVRVVFGFDS